MPESPRWLFAAGPLRTAQAAFGRLGTEVSREDLEQTARQLEAAGQRSERVRRGSWTAGVKRARIVVCVFFIFQQITGINVPLYYGPHLLAPLFQAGSSKVASTIAGVEVTAIMTAVNVAATCLAFRYIDRFGRRKLAISGYTGMALSALLAAAGLLILTGTAQIVVVMIALSTFIASFAVGVAFPAWQSGIGLGWIMFCFAALCVLAIMFVRRFLPETKNRSRRGDHPTVRAAGPGGRRGAGSRPGLTTLRRPLPAGLTTLRRLRAGQARPAGVAGCARRHSSGQRLSRRCR